MIDKRAWTSEPTPSKKRRKGWQPPGHKPAVRLVAPLPRLPLGVVPPGTPIGGWSPMRPTPRPPLTLGMGQDEPSPYPPGWSPEDYMEPAAPSDFNPDQPSGLSSDAPPESSPTPTFNPWQSWGGSQAPDYGQTSSGDPLYPPNPPYPMQDDSDVWAPRAIDPVWRGDTPPPADTTVTRDDYRNTWEPTFYKDASNAEPFQTRMRDVVPQDNWQPLDSALRDAHALFVTSPDNPQVDKPGYYKGFDTDSSRGGANQGSLDPTVQNEVGINAGTAIQNHLRGEWLSTGRNPTSDDALRRIANFLTQTAAHEAAHDTFTEHDRGHELLTRLFLTQRGPVAENQIYEALRQMRERGQLDRAAQSAMQGVGQGQDEPSPYPPGWDPNDYYDPNAAPVVPGNIDLNHRPVVRNPDGSISTVRSMSFGDDSGAETLVPTIGPDGQNWDNQQAINNYTQTGQHLGQFNSATAATNYAQQLHEDQANQYGSGGVVPPRPLYQDQPESDVNRVRAIDQLKPEGPPVPDDTQPADTISAWKPDVTDPATYLKNWQANLGPEQNPIGPALGQVADFTSNIARGGRQLAEKIPGVEVWDKAHQGPGGITPLDVGEFGGGLLGPDPVQGLLHGAGLGLAAGAMHGLGPGERGLARAGEEAAGAARRAYTTEQGVDDLNMLTAMWDANGPTGMQKAVKWLQDLPDNFVNKMTDQQNFLNQAVEKINNRQVAETGQGLPENARLDLLQRANAAGISRVTLEQEFKPALDLVANDPKLTDALRNRLVLEHNIEVARNTGNSERAFAGGLTAERSQHALQTLRDSLTHDEWGKIEEATTRLRNLRDYNRQVMLQSGLIGQDAYEALMANHQHYVRNDVVDYLKDLNNQGSGRSFGNSVRRIIQPLSTTGTTKERVDPLVSIIKQTDDVMRAALQNEKFNAFTRLREIDPGWRSQFRERLDTATELYRRLAAEDPELLRQVRARELSLDEAAQRSGYIVQPALKSLTADQKLVTGRTSGVTREFIADSASADMIRQEPPAQFPVFRTFNQIFKELITGRNPGYVTTVGPIRDFMDYTTRMGAWYGPAAVPEAIVEYARALPDVWKGFRAYGAGNTLEGQGAQRFNLLGGAMSGLYAGQVPKAEDILRNLTSSGGTLLTARTLRDTLRLEPVARIGERMELAPRVAAMRMGERRGLSPRAAMIRGRDVTLDFQRGGQWARALNSAIPFFNPMIQGTAAHVRMMGVTPEERARTVAMLGTTALATTAALEWWNQGRDWSNNVVDPQRAINYDDVPNQYKDNGLVIMMPWGEKTDEQGNRRPDFLWLPTGLMSPYLTLAREAVRRSMSKLPRDPGDMAMGVAASTSPLSGRTPFDLATNVLPQPISTLTQLAADRDAFRNRQINTRFNNEQASALSRWSAQSGLWSASQAEFFLRDLFGSYGAMAPAISDLAAGKRPWEQTHRAQDWPAVGGLASRVVRDAIGQRVVDATKTGGITDPNILNAFNTSGVKLTPPKSTITPAGMPGGEVRLTRDEQLAYLDAYRKAIEFQYRQLPPERQTDKTELANIEKKAGGLATLALTAHWRPEDYQKRLALNPQKANEVDDPKAYRNGLALAADKAANSVEYPRYVGPNDKPLGTPSQWAQWDRELKMAHEGGRAFPLTPQQRVLDAAQKRANGVNLLKTWADPRYADYQRYFDPKYAGLSKAEFTDFKANPGYHYAIAGLTPADGDRLDQAVEMYRAFPVGDPRKYRFVGLAKRALLTAKPGWKEKLDPDGLVLKELTGQLAAQDANYAP